MSQARLRPGSPYCLVECAKKIGNVLALGGKIGISAYERVLPQLPVKDLGNQMSAVECLMMRKRIHHVPLLRSLTPAPPPFGSMNSTPAASRAARIAAFALSEALNAPPPSALFTVGMDTCAAIAT